MFLLTPAHYKTIKLDHVKMHYQHTPVCFAILAFLSRRAAGVPIPVSFAVLALRCPALPAPKGVLWEWYRQLKKDGWTLDASGYSTSFR